MRGKAERSPNLITIRNLTRFEKRLDKLTFPADGYARKSLEPFMMGNVRLGIEPVRK